MFLVIRDFRGPIGPGRRVVTLPEGKVVEDGPDYRIADLVAAGVSLVPATASLLNQVGLLGRERGRAATAVLQQYANGGAVGCTLFVDGQSTLPANSQDGSLLRPFSTIQAAIDALPVRNTSITRRHIDRINITSADYDEDLTIDITNRNLELVGKFNLGIFDQSLWRPVFAPATEPRRHITVTGDTGLNVDGVRSSLVIASDTRLFDLQTSITTAYHAPRISGQIISAVKNSVGGSLPWDLVVEGWVYGTTGDETGMSIDCTGDETDSFVQLSLRNCHIEGGIHIGQTSRGRLVDATQCIFDAEISCSYVGYVSDSRIRGGDWLVSNSTSGIGTPLNGFFNTRFDVATAWTGAHDLFVDAFTNAQVKAAPVTLSGGAVKIIQGDLTA